MVTGVIPSPHRFLPSIFIAHIVQQSRCSSIFHRMLLSHTLALSASQFVHKKKSQRICTSMHLAALELTKLTCTRLEDNLIRHRGDRSIIPLYLYMTRKACTYVPWDKCSSRHPLKYGGGGRKCFSLWYMEALAAVCALLVLERICVEVRRRRCMFCCVSYGGTAAPRRPNGRIGLGKVCRDYPPVCLT